MKVLNLKKKKSHAGAAEIYGKNKSSIYEIMKKKEEIHTSFAVAPHTGKVRATVLDKYLVKLQMTLIYMVRILTKVSSIT